MHFGSVHFSLSKKQIQRNACFKQGACFWSIHWVFLKWFSYFLDSMFSWPHKSRSTLSNQGRFGWSRFSNWAPKFPKEAHGPKAKACESPCILATSRDTSFQNQDTTLCSIFVHTRCSTVTARSTKFSFKSLVEQHHLHMKSVAHLELRTLSPLR